MAPTNGQDPSDDEKQPTNGPDTSKAEAALKARLSRKRTKTGCLTCRKRRIKCGEERPVCKNCIKSKRLCEGYNQRVIFKTPAYDYQAAPNGGAHITFQAGPPGSSTVPQSQGEAPQYMLDGTPYAALQPQPVAQYPAQLMQIDGQQYMVPQQAQYVNQSSQMQPLSVQAVPVEHQVSLPYHAQIQAQQQYHSAQSEATFEQLMAQVDQTPSYNGYQMQPHVAHSYYQQANCTTAAPTSTAHDSAWYVSAQAPTSAAQEDPCHTIAQTQAQSEQSQTWLHRDDSRSWTLPKYTPRPELSRPIDQYQHSMLNVTMQSADAVPGLKPQSSQGASSEYYQYAQSLQAPSKPSDILNEAAVEVQDDDYYDVQSDEEMDTSHVIVSAKDLKHAHALHNILMRGHFDTSNMQMRRFDTFIQGGMLDHYRVEQVANPLRNPATARVFAHFISATGPSLTTFDRHAVSSSVLFTEGAVPVSQQGLWTYVMPMKALHHQGLLHAMLALSSLHIARLDGASATPSMQHYAWALKHIHKCVASPNKKKRLAVTTIAASMLLGFYEIMTADHMKWNTHLMGAKQLFIETDFGSMTRQFRRMKREKAAMQQMYGWQDPMSMHFNGFMADDELDQVNDVDEGVVSQLVGREVRYDQQGHVEDPQASMPQKLDLKKFEIMKDLWWWYCKQDAYQSIVSGNPLLLDYSRWTDCPPRAPLGRPDAVYGSSDHLILILGRIADFASKDRERKLKQMEANGGQWRPAPGMKMPSPPKPPQGQPSTSSAAGPMPSAQPRGPPTSHPVPAFFGMAPPPRANAQMPASYNSRQTYQASQAAPSKEQFDLTTATHAALEEHGRIRAALHAWAAALSDQKFQPLAADLQPQVMTPFGPALFYRSFDVGCLWTLYNMCVIIAIRSHPHMHPAAHVAAGLAAHETKHYATEIGRIAAGIAPGPANQPLNPTIGSALCDTCMPSFFAAVQYQRPDERHETVMRIYGIGLRTGWGSAELIANGCETAWVKAAEAGRGPPYKRVVRPWHSDDPRLNGQWEKLDPDALPEEMSENDRRLIQSEPNARVQWAIGIMGTEDDVRRTR